MVSVSPVVMALSPFSIITTLSKSRQPDTIDSGLWSRPEYPPRNVGMCHFFILISDRFHLNINGPDLTSFSRTLPWVAITLLRCSSVDLTGHPLLRFYSFDHTAVLLLSNTTFALLWLVFLLLEYIRRHDSKSYQWWRDGPTSETKPGSFGFHNLLSNAHKI